MEIIIKHEDVKKYIRDDLNIELSEQISKLRKENSLYQILFEQIDQIDYKEISNLEILIDKKEIQFSNIELLIENIIAGSLDSENKYRFVQLLYHSPNFYSRLITKFNQIHPLLDNSEVKELNEINIKSDDEILNLVRKNIGCVSDKNILHLGVTEKAEKSPNNIWSIPVVRRFIYAAAAMILIVPSIYLLNNQYNTTYKNYTAQNLLQDHYRIYMTGQPRLSGEYQSTGISQLMAGEEDSLNYLNQANEMINEVLRFDSKDKRALHLQAQMLIMQKQYQKADSVLNLALSQDITSPAMLNDLGIVYFEKKEWQKAKTCFKLSIKQDLTYPEAYYNLALTELNLGNIIEAKGTINLFLNFEKDPGWKNAGLNMLNTMEGDIQM